MPLSTRPRIAAAAAGIVVGALVLKASHSQHTCNTIYNRSRLPELTASWTTCRRLPSITGFDVEYCTGRTDTSRGHVLISRRGQCPAFTDSLASDDYVRDELQARGPDAFHVQFNGQYQQWASETPDYLGDCRYRFPFQLAGPQDISIRIWWTLSNWEALKETTLPIHYTEVAQPLLSPESQVIASPDSCGEITAIPTDPKLRTSEQRRWYAALPICDRELPTTGAYLKAHPTDASDTLGGLVYQPTCRYAADIAFRQSAESIQATFQPRSILFVGDSHVRIGFYKLTEGYRGLWTSKMSDANEHAASRNDSIGPLRVDWHWDPMLQDRVAWTCERLAAYDTFVIGGANHNMVKIHTGYPFHFRDQHTHQWTVQEYGQAVADVMRLITNRPDCASRPPPLIIWAGTPAVPPQSKPREPIADPPPEASWWEGRSTQRMQLFSHVAEQAVRAAGGSVIDMLELSQPLAANMTWNHMDVVDSLIALARELHDKIAPSLSAHDARLSR